MKQNKLFHILLKVIPFLLVTAIVLSLVQINAVVYKRRNSNYLTIEELFQDGTIKYNGKYYALNKNMDVYYFFGTDKAHDYVPIKEGDNGGCSDTNILFVVNNDKKQISMMPVNRYISTLQNCYYDNGEYYGKANFQLCIAHTWTKDNDENNKETVRSLQEALYGIPITGYAQMYVDALDELGDIIGDIDIEVINRVGDDDKSSPGYVDPSKYVVGDKITLDKESTWDYLRRRSIMSDSGPQERLERQVQYILKVFDKFSSVSGKIEISKNILNKKQDNESTKERMILSIVLTKAKENPLTERLLRKGVFFI